MPTYIDKDFQPSEISYDNLQKHGAPREFCDDQFDYFMTYWREQAEKKTANGRKESWQMTWQNWMRRAWTGRVGVTYRAQQEARAAGQISPRAQELAQQVLKSSRIPQEQKESELWKAPKTVPRDYVVIEPEKREPMTAEQAFAELRKQGYL